MSAPRRALWQRAMYSTGQTLALLFATVFYRFRRFGYKNIPSTGPFVIVANHQSHMDPPVIGAGIWNRQLTFVARAGLFKNAIFAWTLRSVNAIPIEEGDRAEIATIKKFIERLKQGEAVIVFPEGTRTTDGSISEFKAGAALLIKRANCPVVPRRYRRRLRCFPPRSAPPLPLRPPRRRRLRPAHRPRNTPRQRHRGRDATTEKRSRKPAHRHTQALGPHLNTAIRALSPTNPPR